LLQGDDAPPYWLNTSHPRIRLVHHSDYFVDRTVLPTFSSDAIHVNIHRVPGLGDIMINWCDDFFLGAPVYPEDWVRDGKPVIYLESGYVRGGQTEYERTKARKGNKWLGKVYHTKAVIEREFPDHAASGKRLNFVKHAPFPMSLKVLREMAERYQAEYNQTYRNRFRTYDTVDVPTLHNMYCQVRHTVDLLISSAAELLLIAVG
jgi:hypothetical protein